MTTRRPSSTLLRGLKATARWSGLGQTLPEPVLREVAVRFGRLAAGIVTLKLLFTVPFVLTGYADRFRLSPLAWAGQVLFLASGYGVWWLSRRPGVAPSRAIDAGYAWAVASALVLNLYVNSLPWSDPVMPGYTPTALWATLIALLIPGPPLKATVVTALMLASEPLTVWALVAQGMAAPSAAQLADRFLPSVGALVLIGFITRFMHRVQRRVAAASEVGSYRLVERLGEGGMGEVWRAEHQFLARPAALKIIRPEVLGARADTSTQRFEREAQATAALQSPHTVAVYDFGQADDGRLYYVMELLDGQDLETLVAEQGPLPPARVAWLLRQACRSLAEAHDHGLVHRDVKPANLMVCRHGGEADVLKVLDFGLVRAQAPEDGRLTRDGQITGTPAFAAPEQVLGEAVGPAADLYGLGGVAFWLLTGRTAFPAAHPVAQVAQHLRDRPPAPSTVAPQPVPAGLDALVLQCLAKEPAQRPASARALAQALAPWADQWRPGTPRPPAV